MIEKILIGSIPYSVEYTDPVLSNSKDELLWGEIVLGQQLIKINGGLGQEVKRITLLHEVIHGLLMHYGLSDHKEEVPERLGYALDAFLVANPEFVELYTSRKQIIAREYRKEGGPIGPLVASVEKIPLGQVAEDS